ncbi:tyrosine-type recombinase/integrase [Phaeobacter gallaeciensis]|nr:site-specific integrase [Phaeobacter gallaeciensis]MDE4191242.1 tyrosine-type recombinase/integrase [Phaeobacter gallaeciensis]MDE4199707.1 tyrosine-type recombinase/integrase [Phaeobacter gallaeciensis]MDE4203855.1 tyrosine-type recombinase/integrase [Phaeobacter gallaeciensis]MDE4207997.1 tyrosine-type recombinase/integrase [Phaeobacter gallaeciensis]MDE4216364.1 tyrosine-type recombinase/integrase [Phaeobacter gallaeciensis]
MPDISIGRFRGGYCVYWHEGGKRRRYQLAARTRAEAEPEAIDVYRRETLDQRREKDTVADIWEAYRQDLGDKPTARTMGYTGKAVLAHFGAFRPDQITTSLCRQYVTNRTGAGKSQGTIHTELGHLRSAMRFAVKERIIDRAPSIERPAKPTPKERYLEKKEIAALIDAAASPHIALAIHLLFATAGRIGAILDLTWDRVDFQRGIINLRLEDAKTRKGRAIVPMNAGIRAALQTAHDAALSDYVIEYAGGKVKNIRKGFEAACRRAKLDNVTLHTIRHSSAVAMVSNGVPLEKVAQYLGHSNVAITYQTYARFAPDHLQDAAEILDFIQIREAR